MKIVLELIDKVDNEIESAKECAEKAIELRAEDLAEWSAKFSSMSVQKLSQAEIIHDYLLMRLEKIKAVYVLPAELSEILKKSHIRYIENVALVRQMLKI